MATIVTRLLPFWEARNVKKGVEEAGMMSTESLLNNFLSVFRYFPLKTQFLEKVVKTNRDTTMNSSKVIDQRQQVIILEKARQDLETLREHIFSRLMKELQVTDLWKLLQTYSPGCMSMLTATVFKFCVSKTLSTPDEINAMLLQLSDSFKAAADQYAQCLQHSRSNFMQWSRKSHLHRLETKLQLRQSDNKRSKHLPYELHCLWLEKHRKVVMVNEEFLRPQPCTATRATKEPLGKTARAAHQEIQAHKRNGGFQQVYCGLCHCFQISLNSV
ncbi:hypothetical protein HID58_016478 [Brassica napus]|uniref:Uncharacterized protein n=1 Tax=Brassica napus TaxID=3708 RepID=A0ABQ8DN00_BRANA|nr:hypothetical protein HID58_016478 [Brassica napus]